jgi:hypothetical protein
MAADQFNQRPALETSYAVHVAALSFVMLLPTVAMAYPRSLYHPQ